MNGNESRNESTNGGMATLEPYRERADADESLAELSELGAFYPLITYPAPGDQLDEAEALDPLIMAGLVGPRLHG